MSLSKRTRFEVFKRDLFVCQYCGSSPPAVVLEIDHIVPVSKDGGNDIENLVTSCFDCNRGKAANLLESSEPNLQERAARLAESEEQLAQYRKLLNKKRKRENFTINEIERIFQLTWENFSFKERFKESIRINFLNRLGHDELLGFMAKACERGRDQEGSIKYFCGICWGTIKQDGRGRFRA